MEDKKKELYNAITEKFNQFVKANETFGKNHHLTKMYFREMVGLQEAFKIVFGISHIDYFVDNLVEVAK